MQETTIVGMIPMQETTNIVANVKDCRIISYKGKNAVFCVND